MKQGLCAAAFVLFCSPVVFAANTVSWSAGFPNAGPGKVTGQGTYTADPGWTAGNAQMTAVPVGGGLGQTTTVAAAGGTWGPAVINGLATGSYSITVMIAFRKDGMTQLVYGPTVILPVP